MVVAAGSFWRMSLLKSLFSTLAALSLMLILLFYSIRGPAEILLQIYILREAVRTQLVEGVSLPRLCFTKTGRTEFKCVCDICARANIARIPLPRVRDRFTGVSVGDYVFACQTKDSHL
jgi:hypothetical protein